MNNAQLIFDHADLKLLLTQYAPEYVSTIGSNTLETTIDDFLALGPTEEEHFKLPMGGHNYDRTPQIAIVISLLVFIFDIGKFVIEEKRKRKEVSPERIIEIISPQFEINNVPKDINKKQLTLHIMEILKKNEKK